MNKLLTLSLISAGLGVSQFQSVAFAGDCCHEGGVSYHGRIVMKIHKTWLGAGPAPALPVFVNQAPPMMAVPYVSAPMYTAVPMVPQTFQASPVAPVAPNAPPAVAPTAPNAPATQRDLDELRSSVIEIHAQVAKLAKEVKAIRTNTP